MIAEDFSELLDALESDSAFHMSKPSFHRVSAIRRASTILGVAYLCNAAKHHFEAMWPVSVEHVTTLPIPFVLESIALARRCSVPGVLKRALYELARAPIGASDILDLGLPVGSPYSFGTALSEDDVVKLLHARNWLIAGG
ncbi:hypothetical protein DXG03_003351 [Asterophora parasitica]|uniref:Uncharacterized protein n=1 Tax=Asterophora parasitica TaxID=117018 RepID=A0A9P7G7N5_9AGAR|nr:hypothetical protein DXG03_003351 [Asterophora parasitica]